MNPVINYFSSLTNLTNSEQESLVESMDVKLLKTGDFLVREGQHHINSYFVLSGYLRQYKLIDGNEITTNFYRSNKWIITLDGFNADGISTENIVCIEPTSVVVGNEEKAQLLFKKHPRFETLSRIVMERVFAEQQNWLSSYLTNTPEQRYLKLMETQPEVFQKVPQYHIASYIGVKPESLSRIRKRLHQK